MSCFYFSEGRLNLHAMKKVLFIDRDGTIIAEPLSDYQVDSLDKLEFVPKAITALYNIARQTDYELVMVTNQDGLGTDSFPEETFWPAHNKMIKTLAGEGIHFSAVHIDKSFEHEQLPTRKPGTGMLTTYLHGNYDLANSYVIGDRLTDVKLARNMGAKAILIAAHDSSLASLDETLVLITQDWEEIYRFLSLPVRKARVRRTTKETDILIELNLCQCFVHRKQKTIAVDAPFISQCFSICFAKSKGCIFYRMVFIYMQVAFNLYMQVCSRMLCKLVQHVVEKA